ncbi:uncharacterized protein [Temnothorax longispinosus]|uniref:uncharacterized protein isoform X2 n=1 Tax=Temnothorax longispinosus TaxID=300112 RepID=UPI003A98D6BF
MRYCEAVNCGNSSKKGFKMCHFPTSPNRRAKWIKNVGRDKWSPKKYSTLCEKHFSDEMWENAQKIGKKKLKPTAVPNRFDQPTLPLSSLTTILEEYIEEQTSNNHSEHNCDQEINSANHEINSETLNNHSEHSCDQEINSANREINSETSNNHSKHSCDQEINSETSNNHSEHSCDQEINSANQEIHVLFDSNMQLKCSRNNEDAKKIFKLEKLVKRYARVIKTMQTQHKKQKKIFLNRIQKLKQQLAVSADKAWRSVLGR